MAACHERDPAGEAVVCSHVSDCATNAPPALMGRLPDWTRERAFAGARRCTAGSVGAGGPPLRGVHPRAVLCDAVRLLRLQHLHPRRTGWREPRRLAGRTAHRTAARCCPPPHRPRGRHRFRGWRHAVTARRCRAECRPRRGAGELRARPGCGGHHRSQPRVDVAGVLRRLARRRIHPGVAGDAVHRGARAGGTGSCAFAGSGARCRPRGRGGRVRARQPRSHLRHTGGE